MKITSGDVMTRIPLRLSRRSLAFYYGKVTSFTYSHYVSISLLFTSHFSAFLLFEQSSSKIEYSIIKIRSYIIVSLSFVHKI